jgi:hypothetical protein
MEPREQNDLEKFIHSQLQRLPEREAPETLVANVLAAIAARKKLPWWKQSFSHWPWPSQCVLFTALVSVLAGVLYAVGRAAEIVPVPQISQHLSAYASIGRMLFALGEALVLAVSSLSAHWWLAIAFVFALLYGACLAAGFALFRVTSAAGSTAA